MFGGYIALGLTAVYNDAFKFLDGFVSGLIFSFDNVGILFIGGLIARIVICCPDKLIGLVLPF